VLWLTARDKNSKFFHQKANQRRRKNLIEAISNSIKLMVSEKDQTENCFLTYFHNIFSSQHTQNIVVVVSNKLTPTMVENLQTPFTAAEVYKVINTMKGLDAPSPDDLPVLFYHTYWDIVGSDITNIVLNVFNNQGDPSSFNNTNICFIPKNNDPKTHSDYRLISLCNVTIKIITKTIANRLKPVLNNIINPNQSAFLPGRLIFDNTIIAYELFQFFQQTTSKEGFIGMKTNMGL